MPGNHAFRLHVLGPVWVERGGGEVNASGVAASTAVGGWLVSALRLAMPVLKRNRFPVGFFGQTGADAAGSRLRAELTALGVDISPLRLGPELATPLREASGAWQGDPGACWAPSGQGLRQGTLGLFSFDAPSGAFSDAEGLSGWLDTVLAEMSAAKQTGQIVLAAAPGGIAVEAARRAIALGAEPHLWMVADAAAETPEELPVEFCGSSGGNALVWRAGEIRLQADAYPFGQALPLRRTWETCDAFQAAPAIVAGVLLALATEIVGDDLFSKQHRKLDCEGVAMRPFHALRLMEFACAFLEMQAGRSEDWETALLARQGPPGKPWATGARR